MSNCCYSAFSPRTSELTTDARMRPAPRPGPHWPQGLATRRRGLRTAKRKDEGEMTQTRQPSPAQPRAATLPCLHSHSCRQSQKGEGGTERFVRCFVEVVVSVGRYLLCIYMVSCLLPAGDWTGHLTCVHWCQPAPAPPPRTWSRPGHSLDIYISIQTQVFSVVRY